MIALSADAAHRLQVAGAGDADDQRREQQRRDDHLDHAQEGVGERPDGDAELGPELADDDAEQQPDEDLRRDARHATAARRTGARRRAADRRRIMAGRITRARPARRGGGPGHAGERRRRRRSAAAPRSARRRSAGPAIAGRRFGDREFAARVAERREARLQVERHRIVDLAADARRRQVRLERVAAAECGSRTGCRCVDAAAARRAATSTASGVGPAIGPRSTRRPRGRLGEQRAVARRIAAGAPRPARRGAAA